jgi:hypothetical protein
MTLADEIRSKHDIIVAKMIALGDPSLTTPADEGRQFTVGFVHLVEAAAAGDTRPRDEYLAVVIPGVQASGFPLESILDSMVRVSMALTATLEAVHHTWLANFCGDYTRRLLRLWERTSE